MEFGKPQPQRLGLVFYESAEGDPTPAPNSPHIGRMGRTSIPSIFPGELSMDGDGASKDRKQAVSDPEYDDLRRELEDLRERVTAMSAARAREVTDLRITIAALEQRLDRS